MLSMFFRRVSISVVGREATLKCSCRTSEIIDTYMVVGEMHVVMGHPLRMIPWLKHRS